MEKKIEELEKKLREIENRINDFDESMKFYSEWFEKLIVKCGKATRDISQFLGKHSAEDIQHLQNVIEAVYNWDPLKK